MVERTNGAGTARALTPIAMKRAECRVSSDGNPRVDSGELMVDGRNGGASVNYQPLTINELWLSRHASRVTRHATAFTLIELLVVIAIIAILAALIFPAAAAIKRRATLTKVQTEMKQVATAIDFYKEKLSFYPPDNPTPVTDP